ncbi:MAG TPA: site-specific integrase [Pyrinomonadaceae bacterium]|jgi:integrase
MWVVERLDVDGEELPILRHAEMWLPAPIALRYALWARFRVGPSSLTNDFRAIAILYNWAEATEGIGYFEDFLTSGRVLTRDQLLAFLPYLQSRRYIDADELITLSPDYITLPPIVGNQTYNARLVAVREFIGWTVEPVNHSGDMLFDEDERELKLAKMARLCNEHTLTVGESLRPDPITKEEIRLIRKAIMPDELGNYPPNGFRKATRFRNWIMFEVALNLGLRKGELLTLKVSHLPALIDLLQFFFVPRQQDAPEDPRKRRRLRGKTNERRVPLMEPDLLPSILGYRDAAPPIGRNDPRITSPYFFVTSEGQPIACSTADHIIKQIGKYAARLVDEDMTLDEHVRARLKESLLALSWHRLRHTWAEQAAQKLYLKYGVGAWAILKEWGGWNSEESMERYIEYAKRAISEQAAREYLSSFSKKGKH